ncbi:hypothetical protein CI102_1521 [Trichoderma harzianum]|nr:hypothetical protein CI102_1521 [Trichoderma harzianum]
MLLSHVVFGVTYFFRTAIASILQKPWPRCPAAHVVGSFTEPCTYRDWHLHGRGLSVQCKFLCEASAQVHTSELYLQFSWFHCRQSIVHGTVCCFHLLPPFPREAAQLRPLCCATAPFVRVDERCECTELQRVLPETTERVPNVKYYKSKPSQTVLIGCHYCAARESFSIRFCAGAGTAEQNSVCVPPLG